MSLLHSLCVHPLRAFLACSLVFLSLALFPSRLAAEIVWVDIYWTEACNSICANMVKQRLGAIPAVAHVEVYPSEGRARMQWRQNYKLDYMMIKSAVAWVGVDISDMLVQVRGKILSSSSDMVLMSTGDSTRFNLLGIPQVSHTQMTNWENAASYPLSHAIRQQLWSAKQSNTIVTIQGPLFQFWNPNPLNLIVNQLQIGEDKPQSLQTQSLPPQAPFRNDPWRGQPSRFRAPANPQKTNAIQPLQQQPILQPID